MTYLFLAKKKKMLNFNSNILIEKNVILFIKNLNLKMIMERIMAS